MPIYEYECTHCGHQSEALQRMSDPPLTQCELCKGHLKKLISQNTFHLKGSGWYVTDYASDRSKSQSDQSGPKNETSNKKEDTSSNKKESKSSSTETKKKN